MRYVNKSHKAKHGKKYFKYLRLFSCNFPYSEHNSLTHTGNCTKYKLCYDVEENPGPVMHHVDLRSDTLCRHNFEHNTMDRASSIMPA